MKKPSTKLKELKFDLHFWQMMVRIDVTSLQRTRAKCKKIAAKMRALQKDIK